MMSHAKFSIDSILRSSSRRNSSDNDGYAGPRSTPALAKPLSYAPVTQAMPLLLPQTSFLYSPFNAASIGFGAPALFTGMGAASFLQPLSARTCTTRCCGDADRILNAYDEDDNSDDSSDADSTTGSTESHPEVERHDPESPSPLYGGATVNGKSIEKSKKRRTAFTREQLQCLEMRFNQQKYLTRRDRCSLAKAVGLTEKHVKTWYQNRRTKWKRDCTEVDWSLQREIAAKKMHSQYLSTRLPSAHQCPVPTS